MNEDENMVPEEEGLDNIIVLNDENGEEVPFEFLDLIELDGEEYVVITNFSKDEELINFPFDNYTLVISNYNSNYSKSSLTLKPYEALLLKRK